jgi:bifunctional NMN adenylyltransferase/nudix hydrolase
MDLVTSEVPPYDVGVIVGRFQVPDLHTAHIEIIKDVCTRHNKVIIFLGLAPVFSISNPLDFEARKRMIEATFPNVIIAYIKDMPSDEAWSKYLDAQIGALIGPHQTAVLYGSRDSFLPRYSGHYPVRELKQVTWVSGRELRATAKNHVKGTSDFRHGAIWAAWQRFPTSFQTVDIIVRKDNEILVGKRDSEELHRFPGGFVDPKKDDSLELAAARELSEEVPGIDVGGAVGFSYVSSIRLNDWRYRSTPDKIMTTLFKATYIFGRPEPGDDLDKVMWVPVDKVSGMLVPDHELLWKMYQARGGLTNAT